MRQRVRQASESVVSTTGRESRGGGCFVYIVDMHGNGPTMSANEAAEVQTCCLDGFLRNPRTDLSYVWNNCVIFSLVDV